MSQPLCWELRIAPPPELKGRVVEILHLIDESDFVEGIVDCDIEFDYEIASEFDYSAGLPDNGPVSYYSENKDELTEKAQRIRDGLVAHNINIELFPIEICLFSDQNWRESWKASFKPVHVGASFCILPPWENPEMYSEKHKIVIDPGMAFGTGQHETTRLCLEIFSELPCPQRVFDVGAGSGILAIAAKMWGAKEVLGCDCDSDSVRIAQENAEKNGVPDVVFNDTPIAIIESSDFDLSFANIQNKPLLKIFGDIVRRTRSGGRIIVSGILESECNDFCDFVSGHGVQVDFKKQLGHWMGILCKVL